MIFSVQLLKIDEQFTGELNSEHNRKQLNLLRDSHENFLSNREYELQGITEEDIENETEEYINSFTVFDLTRDDIEDNSVTFDSKKFDESLLNCCLIDVYTDCIYLNNNNGNDFYYVLKVLSELDCEVNFIDENYVELDYTVFKDLISEKQETSNQVVINYITYSNEEGW